MVDFRTFSICPHGINSTKIQSFIFSFDLLGFAFIHERQLFVDITGIGPARKSALMTDDLRKPVIPIFSSFSQPSGLSEPSYLSCFGSRFCLRDSLQAILYATISHCVIFCPLLRSFA